MIDLNLKKLAENYNCNKLICRQCHLITQVRSKLPEVQLSDLLSKKKLKN